MSETHPALLPNGLKDLLPPEAERESYTINKLLKSFSLFGYRQVKPPLVEFEESLLSGPGQALAKNTFRLMDPVSQRMMGLRADTTAQISRVAASRLKDESRPLRLSYAADVLRVNGSQLRPERQFCQVGCELIGAGPVQDDIEIALVALKALSDVEVKDLSIDLTVPVLIDTLFDVYNVDSIAQGHLETLIYKRDRDALAEQGNDLSSILVALVDGSGKADKAIKSLQDIKLPKQAETHIQSLATTYEGLKQALGVYDLENVNITLDLIERRGFEYQKGISFTLFSTQARGELGRGGRYSVSEKEAAVGFTLYMDSVQQAAGVVPEEKRKDVSDDTSWEDIKKLQDDGFLVTRKR
jgi:ATP phosphoribosyltransferase regulatory subunit